MVKRDSLVAWLGLAVLLALGLGVVWGGVAAWCETWADYCLQPEDGYRYVRVLMDGTPVVISYSQSDYSGQRWTTLDGEEIPSENRNRMGILAGEDLPGLYAFDHVPRELPWSQRLAVLNDRRDPPGLWYFVHSGVRDGSGYFEGFDSKSKLRVGYLGTAGFRDELPPPEERFAMDGRAFGGRMAVTGAYYRYGEGDYVYVFRDRPGAKVPPWVAFMISGERILKLDVRQGTAEKIMDVPGAIALGMASRASSLEQEMKRPMWEPRPLFLTIRTPAHLVLADPDGREMERYVIPEPLRYQNAIFHLMQDHTLLAISAQRREGDQVTELTWFGPSGQVSRHEEVVTNRASILSKPPVENWVMAAILPSPIVYSICGVAEAMPSGALDRLEIVPILTRALAKIWPALLAVCLVSAGLAVLCYRRQRRYALPGTWVWVAFVFLTGVPGLLAYRFHRGWPALDPCPACGHVVPRDREACAACRTEFPRPAPKGIEVFA